MISLKQPAIVIAFAVSLIVLSGVVARTESSTAGDGDETSASFQWGLPGDIPVPKDFDSDGRTDLAVWRPSNGTWYILYGSEAGYTTWQSFQLGQSGDSPLPNDFDGDGRIDLAVWRPSNGTWYIRHASDTGYTASSSIQWGLSGDIPVPDWFYGPDYSSGDMGADLAVWRPSDGTWYIRDSHSEVWNLYSWGLPGDIPVTSDFDLDFRADLGVWRPSDGTWNVLPSSNGYTGFITGLQGIQWGLPGDIPVPSDFNGEGWPDLVVWRPSDGTWYIRYSSLGDDTTYPTSESFQWGQLGDVPLPNDYNFDGVSDLAVWRPSNGTWYIRYTDPTPVISAVSVDPLVLSPPNHQLVDVTLKYTVTSLTPSTCALTVTSNEPENGLGNGDRTPDWSVLDANHVRLRAERSGRGFGRVYTVSITCMNSVYFSATHDVTVAVPK
jgi:hypothetical protein